MPWVTAPPVSANNLQHLLPMYSPPTCLRVFSKYETSRPTAKATSTRGSVISGTMQDSFE